MTGRPLCGNRKKFILNNSLIKYTPFLSRYKILSTYSLIIRAFSKNVNKELTILEISNFVLFKLKL